MTSHYEQFLGSKPGTVVELIDESTAPYRVRTESGFEFLIAAEDFRNYYRPVGEPTPKRWGYLVTDPATGMIDSRKAGGLMDLIRAFEPAFQDFAKARDFLGEAVRRMDVEPSEDAEQLRALAGQFGGRPADLGDRAIDRLLHADAGARRLLAGDSYAVVPILAEVGGEGQEAPAAIGPEGGAPQPAAAKERKTAPGKVRQAAGMKNVELTVDGDRLTVVVDLSKDFGPSKSGKTQIVASTEGNRSVPGRTEKIGLNVYRQESKKSAKGRKSSFKNVEMTVEGDLLRITVDLSKEFGPSKSGKTIIIASTEGNQLVVGREEKIGLNLYKKLE